MTDPITTPAQMREAAALVERVAAAMWSAEAMRAALNVGHTRTPERFASWLCLAEAAIRAMPVAEPEPQAVKVKPLEFEGRNGFWRAADGLGGFYEICEVNGGFHMTRITSGVGSAFVTYPTIDAAKDAANADNEARVLSQIDAVSVAQVRAEALREADYFGSLVLKARTAATKASIKFPQPNYVTLKIAEEAGEVVRGAVHYAEGRMEWAEIEGEIVQLLAMLIRFVTEGDEINGVIPPSTLPAAEPAPVAVNAVMCAAERDAQSRVAVDLTLFRQAVRAEALEEAAKLADAITERLWHEYKTERHFATDHLQGMSDGAGEVADAIRALMEKPE